MLEMTDSNIHKNIFQRQMILVQVHSGTYYNKQIVSLANEAI